METLKQLLADVEAIRHAHQMGVGHDLIVQSLDALKAKIAGAIATLEAEALAEAERK